LTIRSDAGATASQGTELRNLKDQDNAKRLVEGNEPTSVVRKTTAREKREGLGESTRAQREEARSSR
jgi:hypothetical protein